MGNMANTIPGSYPLPDPSQIQAGEAIAEPQGQVILDASNWHAAAPRECFTQCWNYTDDPCQRAAAFPAMPAAGTFGSHVAMWPVPKYGTSALIQVYAYGRRDGAVGNVRFRSVRTGSTVTLALGLADAWTAIGNLAVDCGPGWDWIEMYLEGDGVADAHMFTVAGEFPALSGALAAPSAADDPTPFDAAELSEDEPWSSDVNMFLLDNIETYLGWLQPYYTWSGIQNTSTGAKASYSQPLWHHQVVTSIHRGTRRESLAWTARAFVSNVSGGAETILVKVGERDVEGVESAVIDVPGPAGPKFVSGSVQATDVDARGREQSAIAEIGHPMAFVTLPAETQANVHSVTVWGV